MNNCFLGIDYGTGGCKACIIDERANVLSYAYREYPIITNQELYSEHIVSNYWPATCSMIKECLKKSGITPENIKGIGTSSAMPSLVMIDKNGEPINNAYNLMDRRAKKQVKWLEDTLTSEKVFEITANHVEDHPVLVNLLWEKENRPNDFKRIDKALTIDGYIRYKFTGEKTSHYSAGIFYGVAYNILKREFDKDILDYIGLDIDLLPKFSRCEDIIGYVTKDAALECSLVEGIPVACGQVDCNAGWLGGGATEVGDIQLNLGTCGNFGVVHNTTNFIQEMFNFPYTIDCTNTYVTVSTTLTGGQVMRYLKENFSHLENAMSKLVPNFDSYDYLNFEAESVPLGCEGLIVLPYLMGERTPIWDTDARGVIFGLSLHHTKAHLVRAMMEGVAFAMYDSFRIFQQKGIKMNVPMVMNEGGAKSKLWRRIITDTLNIPTVMLKSRVGAPYGDALLAAVSTGYLNDYSIVKQRVEYVDRLDPIPENHEKYMKHFKVYKNIYEHLKDDFKDLKSLV